ncbi:hypothetical protein M569_16948, partial [Genlisea aurea]
QDICSNHEECESRCDQIQLKKGFVAKEPVKGHMMNVVRGLKLYEGIFNEAELSKLRDFVNELQVAGRNGELSGDTFILYNQQMKGNKRELIQLGVPIFRKVQYDETPEKDCIEPIPALIEGVIRHLIQWHLIPETRRPNSCIINFFDEGEYSQPFLKPPHLEQPLSTLTLSDSTMAFGRILVSDGEGNYKGTLMLSLKQGSLLVMRGNSSDTARHAMCASPNKRISITFFKVRSDVDESESESNHPMMLWQPYGNTVHAPYETVNGGEAMNLFPRWSFLSAPLVMVATAPAISPAVGPQRIPPCGGTGVFLPWAIGSRRHVKHLPPRAQKGRLLALPPPAA